MEKKYLLVLFVSLLAGINFPDLDLALIFLWHRSIITHGILVPFFIYRFLTKYSEKPFLRKYLSKFLTNTKIKNEFLEYVYIGFLIGIAINLCADIFPKAYIGFALIKLPFWISIGAPLSFVWMFGNMFFALKIAFKKIKEKNVDTKSKNRLLIYTLIIGITYCVIDTNFVSKIALMVVSFPIIWVYAKRGYKVIKKWKNY